MDLNLPCIGELEHCENLSIARMGSGFDVFCGLPIYFELRRRGRSIADERGPRTRAGGRDGRRNGAFRGYPG